MEQDGKIDPTFFSTCRLCVAKPGNYQILPSTQRLIKELFEISVEVYDGLPQLICDECRGVISKLNTIKRNFQLKQHDLIEQRKRFAKSDDLSDESNAVASSSDVCESNEVTATNLDFTTLPSMKPLDIAKTDVPSVKAKGTEAPCLHSTVTDTISGITGDEPTVNESNVRECDTSSLNVDCGVQYNEDHNYSRIEPEKQSNQSFEIVSNITTATPMQVESTIEHEPAINDGLHMENTPLLHVEDPVQNNDLSINVSDKDSRHTIQSRSPSNIQNVAAKLENTTKDRTSGEYLESVINVTPNNAFMLEDSDNENSYTFKMSRRRTDEPCKKWRKMYKCKFCSQSFLRICQITSHVMSHKNLLNLYLQLNLKHCFVPLVRVGPQRIKSGPKPKYVDKSVALKFGNKVDNVFDHYYISVNFEELDRKPNVVDSNQRSLRLNRQYYTEDSDNSDDFSRALKRRRSKRISSSSTDEPRVSGGGLSPPTTDSVCPSESKRIRKTYSRHAQPESEDVTKVQVENNGNNNSNEVLNQNKYTKAENKNETKSRKIKIWSMVQNAYTKLKANCKPIPNKKSFKAGNILKSEKVYLDYLVQNGIDLDWKPSAHAKKCDFQIIQKIKNNADRKDGHKPISHDAEYTNVCKALFDARNSQSPLAETEPAVLAVNGSKATVASSPTILNHTLDNNTIVPVSKVNITIPSKPTEMSDPCNRKTVIKAANKTSNITAPFNTLGSILNTTSLAGDHNPFTKNHPEASESSIKLVEVKSLRDSTMGAGNVADMCNATSKVINQDNGGQNIVVYVSGDKEEGGSHSMNKIGSDRATNQMPIIASTESLADSVIAEQTSKSNVPGVIMQVNSAAQNFSNVNTEENNAKAVNSPVMLTFEALTGLNFNEDCQNALGGNQFSRDQRNRPIAPKNSCFKDVSIIKQQTLQNSNPGVVEVPIINNVKLKSLPKTYSKKHLSLMRIDSSQATSKKNTQDRLAVKEWKHKLSNPKIITRTRNSVNDNIPPVSDATLTSNNNCNQTFSVTSNGQTIYNGTLLPIVNTNSISNANPTFSISNSPSANILTSSSSTGFMHESNPMMLSSAPANINYMPTTAPAPSNTSMLGTLLSTPTVNVDPGSNFMSSLPNNISITNVTSLSNVNSTPRIKCKPTSFLMSSAPSEASNRFQVPPEQHQDISESYTPFHKLVAGLQLRGFTLVEDSNSSDFTALARYHVHVTKSTQKLTVSLFICQNSLNLFCIQVTDNRGRLALAKEPASHQMQIFQSVQLPDVTQIITSNAKVLSQAVLDNTVKLMACWKEIIWLK